MEGFGASITDSSAHLLARLDRGTRNATMREPVPRTQPAVVPAPADGRLGLRRRAITTPTTTCRPARPTTGCGASRSRTTARRSCRCCARRSALNPQIKVDRLALEPAGLDEDEPVADRRPADRLRHGSTPPYARYFVKFVQAYKRAGVPIYGAHGPERAAEPQAGRLPRHGHAGGPQAKLIEALGPALKRARLRHEDPRLRPQLVDAPGRHRLDTGRRGAGDRVPDRAAESRAARWIDGTAFHCYGGDPSRQTELQHALPATRASGSPSARARTARPTRRRRSSPTRSSGTRATSCSG